MTAELTPAALLLFGYLPAGQYGFEEDPDPIVARWLGALGKEHERVRDYLDALAHRSTPATATDELGALSRWEATLGLPVAPQGVAEDIRRQTLVARLVARRVARGLGWRAAMDAAIAGEWSVSPNTPQPDHLTIHVPFLATDYRAGAVRALARDITPATVPIHWDYGGQFIVGVSHVGDTI